MFEEDMHFITRLAQKAVPTPLPKAMDQTPANTCDRA